MTTALRSPVLVDLQHALAAEIGIRHPSPAARRLLDLLTIVVARSYSLACRADARYQILNGDVQRVWRASERLACQEAHAAARVVTQSAFSDEAKTAAGIELASFVTEVLKIQVGAIPNSIGHTSKPAELARIVQYDYFIGATQELLSERWNRPTITSARAYIRSALTREAHRHYVGKLQEQRLLDSIEPLRVPIPTEFRADHVVVPIDLEHGLAVLRGAGMQDDLATLIVERYLRHQRPGDIGVDQEAAQELGWSPRRLQQVQAALHRTWGSRIQAWFEAGSYRPRKKLENRVGSEGENLPLVSRGENQ